MSSMRQVGETAWWWVRTAMTIVIGLLMVRAAAEFFTGLQTFPPMRTFLDYVDPRATEALAPLGLPWSHEVRGFGTLAVAAALSVIRLLADDLIARVLTPSTVWKPQAPAAKRPAAAAAPAAAPAAEPASAAAPAAPAGPAPQAEVSGTQFLQSAQSPRQAKSGANGPSGRIGRYDIVKELGRGAMGIVYKGTDPTIGRTVAIKTLSAMPTGPEMDLFRQRFLVEARSAGRLNHPGIVSVYDVADDELGRPALVLEYVPGKPLDELLSEKALSPLQVVDIVAQIARALAHAHGNGIIHRDVKPANIMVTDDGQAKLSDFGVAKMDNTGLTQAGQVVGTPAFMSPEQCTGGTLDSRSDIFSLGSVLYNATTGARPFPGDTFASVAYNVVHEMPVPPTRVQPALPAGIDRIIWRAMAKAPADRYASAADLAADLEGLKPDFQ